MLKHIKVYLRKTNTTKKASQHFSAIWNSQALDINDLEILTLSYSWRSNAKNSAKWDTVNKSRFVSYHRFLDITAATKHKISGKHFRLTKWAEFKSCWKNKMNSLYPVFWSSEKCPKTCIVSLHVIKSHNDWIYEYSFNPYAFYINCLWSWNTWNRTNQCEKNLLPQISHPCRYLHPKEIYNMCIYCFYNMFDKSSTYRKKTQNCLNVNLPLS